MEDFKNIVDYQKMNKSNQLVWYTIVSDIINSEEFLIRKNFLHHDNESLYEHLIKVSIKSFLLAQKYQANIEIASLAGLLHDFYSEAWQNSPELVNIDPKYSINLKNKTHKSFFHKHGFVHGIDAYNNVVKYYPYLNNKKIEDAITKHMFPLTIFTKMRIPKYKESWLVTISDKKASFSNFPKIKNWPKYLGMKRDKNV